MKRSLQTLFLLAGIVFSPLAEASRHPKVIMIGMDGLDPALLKEFVDAGRMPTFEKFIREGRNYSELETSIPPQSPVAWSNVITGHDSGVHGIFDFLHRYTLLPGSLPNWIPEKERTDYLFPGGKSVYFSTSRARPPKLEWRVGNWMLPILAGEMEQLRQGKAFWEILDDHGIPVTIFRIPSNFPPIDTKRGRAMSGMGTTDLRGTQGEFTLFSSNPPMARHDNVSGGSVVLVEAINNAIYRRGTNNELPILEGPESLRIKQEKPRGKYAAQTSSEPAPIRYEKTGVPLSISIDPEFPVARIDVQNHRLLLQVGEWSDWVDVEFEVLPLIGKVSGIVRFYLKEVYPDFHLYVTPIQADPRNPAVPISNPPDYAKELYEAIGFFYSQNMPEDTKALQHDVLNNEEFLEQVSIVLKERQKALDFHLDRFATQDEGFTFFYFSSSDQIMHACWRLFDEAHPSRTTVYEDISRMSDIAAQVYEDMDIALQKVLNRVDEETTVIVMSDHGFTPFYRGVNLNTWLHENGYVVLDPRIDRNRASFWVNVNWRETRAYSMGMNGIFINLKGREVNGIVDPRERDELVREISEKLMEIRDETVSPDIRTALTRLSGEDGRVITRVYVLEDTYEAGPWRDHGPDITVGFNRGYRGSWDTILGEFPPEIIVDNRSAWSGDHCIDHTLVPGVVLSNRPILMENPALQDIPRMILQCYGILNDPDIPVGKPPLGDLLRNRETVPYPSERKSGNLLRVHGYFQ